MVSILTVLLWLRWYNTIKQTLYTYITMFQCNVLREHTQKMEWNRACLLLLERIRIFLGKHPPCLVRDKNLHTALGQVPWHSVQVRH